MKEIKDTLIKYNQEELLRFYDELSLEEQVSFLEEIRKTNFSLMERLYKDSYKSREFNLGDYSELKAVYQKEINNPEKAINLIKNNGYGIVILGGGHGSRLGYNGPKGCYELNINNKRVSLYELYINQLKDIYNKYHVYINLYIMTSTTNDIDTRNYFIEHNYFDYKEEYIHFFIQDNLPILDVNGKMLLKDKGHLLVGPNGNGDVYSALKSNKLLEHMTSNNIKYVLFMPIDNPLVKMVDLSFLEKSLNSGYGLVTKTILKTSDEDMNGVFCKYKGKPAILAKDNMTKEINNIKVNGEYIYRDTNIIYHLMSIDNLIKFSDIELPYHRAYKKNKCLDTNGNLVIPNEPNTFKFEQFIYDAFMYTDDMLLYRVGNDEFMPIKTIEDVKKVEEYLNKDN